MPSGIQTLHPALSTIRRLEWQIMRDCMDGEGAVKQRGEEYLTCPPGYKTQADGGKALYLAYIKRAQFPELLAPSVAAMIGIIHGREIKINMPDAMEYLWENCDGNALPLEAFHRRITRELLVIGSYGILTDAPIKGGNPYLAGYPRDLLINWDREWYVLNETHMERKGFAWEQLEQYRLLTVDNGFFVPWIYDADGNGEQIVVRGRGGAALERIPFVVGTAMDLSPRIEAPPLIGVARAALAIYRKSADQENSLYMSGNPTLVAIDGPAPAAVGAGVVHEMHSSADKQADLKYVEAGNTGIKDRRAEMEADRMAAVMAGARLFEDRSAQESGEAKRLRYASETATLVSIAQNSCMLLERALRNAAMIMGMSEQQQAEIVVHAPTDLMDRRMSAQDFAALFGVYQQGGISWDTFFANGQQGGIFSPEDTPEIEASKLDGLDLSDNGIV